MSIKKELINLIKVDIKNDIVSQLMDRFDNEIIVLEDEDDPMRPSVCREEFKSFLEETIENSLMVTKDQIKFGVGDERKLGFTEELDPDTTDCLKIIGTILQGISGRYVLVTTEMAREMFPRERYSRLGRTGQAYLMSREEYNQGIELRGWIEKPDWRFSDFPGIPDFFEQIQLDMNKYIKKLGAR
jgi:hypothetical protein